MLYHRFRAVYMQGVWWCKNKDPNVLNCANKVTEAILSSLLPFLSSQFLFASYETCAIIKKNIILY